MSGLSVDRQEEKQIPCHTSFFMKGGHYVQNVYVVTLGKTWHSDGNCEQQISSFFPSSRKTDTPCHMSKGESGSKLSTNSRKSGIKIFLITSPLSLALLYRHPTGIYTWVDITRYTVFYQVFPAQKFLLIFVFFLKHLADLNISA